MSQKSWYYVAGGKVVQAAVPPPGAIMTCSEGDQNWIQLENPIPIPFSDAEVRRNGKKMRKMADFFGVD